MSPEFKLTLFNLTVGFVGLHMTFVLILTSMACYYYSWITLMITHRAYIACAIPVGLIPLVLLYRWYKYQLRGGNERCPDSISLSGKTIIVTGGNAGIGKGAAVDLARRGARVIIACRSAQRAGEAVREIKAKSGSDNVLFRKLDLASFRSVREFADRILQKEERLDVLINNAGVTVDAVDSGGNPALTEDGLALCFQINHYGPFLLTHLLLDLLRKSAPSRVVKVTSVTMAFHTGSISTSCC